MEVIDKKEYISKIEVVRKLQKAYAEGRIKAKDGLASVLDDVNAADVQSIRRGRWIYKGTVNGWDEVACSHCDAAFATQDIEQIFDWDYCPRCGSDNRNVPDTDVGEIANVVEFKKRMERD